MATDTEIANYALLSIGESKIMNLDDESKSARIAKVFYSQTRDEVLRAHRWSFAMKRIKLTKGSDPVYGYDSAFNLPSDFVRAVEINQRDVFDAVRNFEIEEGSRLLTNEIEVHLKYIFREVDAEHFDVLFVESLSIKLAAKLAMNLAGDADMGNGFLTQYQTLTAPLAKKINAEELHPAIPYQPTDSRLSRARRLGVFGDSFPDRA